MYAEILIVLMHLSCAILTSVFNCKLPYGCEINVVQFIVDYSGNEKTSMGSPGILCNIRDETFRFDYPMPEPLFIPGSKDWCYISTNELDYDTIEFRFPSNFILDKQFNLKKMLNYTWYLKYGFGSNFVNLKGFELDITNDKKIHIENSTNDFKIQCIRSKIEFYSNGRHIKTCQDIIDEYPSGNISSLFQIQRLDAKTWITMFHSEFKTTLCPLLFKNSDIKNVYFIGLVDSYYKRNILTIENRTFDDLNSTILNLCIMKAEKINIDSNLLNPSVFQHLIYIYLSGSFNNIDGNSLNLLKELNEICIAKKNFRDIIHKNGIKWIRDLNAHLDVNLSNFEELKKDYHQRREIQIGVFNSKTEIRSSKLFPDEDFCLYKEFPFNQLVILMEYAYDHKIFALLDSNRHYTCSYLWLTQYFDRFLKLDK